MNPAQERWPPLIVATKKPTSIWIRDALITIGMWGIFILMLTTTFQWFNGSLLDRIGFGDFGGDVDQADTFGRLKPYVLAACGLLGALCVAGLITIRRRRQALLLAPPRLLDLADDARRASMDEGTLVGARSLRSTVLEIDDEGAVSVERSRTPPRQREQGPAGSS